MAVTTMIGAKIHRREDPRLITGHGRYIDDMTRPGMAHMVVVRSPHAHAKIRSIDPSSAKKAAGVHAVYTYADFKDHISGGLPVSASFVAEKKQVPNQFPIAHDEVVYQGEPVAVVLADERSQAADAASLVQVERGVPWPFKSGTPYPAASSAAMPTMAAAIGNDTPRATPSAPPRPCAMSSQAKAVLRR